MFQDFKSDPFMFMIAVGVIVFVIAQSLFFLLRAIKRGKQIGLTSETIKNTISSSALFSIAPAISIAVTVLVLSVALGYVLPWIRLSVIGAIQYEVPAAEAAIDAAGLSGGIGRDISDPKTFTAIAWVMSLGCILPLILIPIILKKVQKKVSGTVNKNAKWADLMSAAAFIGLISAFLGRGIAGIGEVQITESGEKINAVIGDGAGVLSITAIISSIVFMLLLTLLNKKLQWKWLEAFSMPFAMLLSIGVIVLLNTVAPDFAAIEWRY
ncbi:MAG: DUF5058 family protein [Clostridia bacterium]|jgi:hypothetical protein|nr:DUF5058 family protein [Clostridia bacterium]